MLRSYGQGAIEYLLVIGMVVLVSAIVITVLPSAITDPNNQFNQVDSAYSTLRDTAAGSPITVIAATLSPNEGDASSTGSLTYTTKNGTSLTISTLGVNGSPVSFSSSAGSGSSTVVTYLVSTTNTCQCPVNGSGASVACNLTFTFSDGSVVTRPTTMACSGSTVNLFLRGDGNGTVGNPWKIQTCSDLNKVREKLSDTYQLASDINCSVTTTWNGGAGFEPIGIYVGAPFAGTLDGANHTISGLYQYRPLENYVGLFQYVGPSGTIKNMGLVNNSTEGYLTVGGLAAYNKGTITSSYATGSVRGASGVGGLVGVNNYGAISLSNTSGTAYSSGGEVGGLVGQNLYGTITNSYSSVNVSNPLGGNNAGGLIGSSYGNTTNVYATGNVVSTGSDVGGLFGYHGANYALSNAHADGNVSGDFYVGGLSGLNAGTITTAYAKGKVTGTGSFVGGLVGKNSQGVITNSYATNTVVATGSHVGGLVGLNETKGNISYTFATGSVSGSSYVGGLVGDNTSYGTLSLAASISNSFATGAVTGTSKTGGLVGENYTYCTVTNGYFDITRTSKTLCCGSGTGPCSSCTGKNPASPADPNAWYPMTSGSFIGDYNVPMQHNTSSTNDWNFTTIWQKNTGAYPTLR